MTTVYSVFPDGEIGGTKIFKTLREAKAHIQEYNIRHYVLNKCRLTPITVDSLIRVVNEQGGAWCAGTETIKDTLND